VKDHYWKLLKENEEIEVKHACPWLGMRVDLILSHNSDSKPRDGSPLVQELKDMAFFLR
jgi:hypothetical protein